MNSSPQRGEAGRGETQRGEAGRGAEVGKKETWHPSPVPKTLLEAARNLRKDMTDAEQTLWHYLRGKQIGGFRFRKQHPIERYVLDFYCPRVKLAIELDGGQHNTESGRNYDEARTHWLNSQGIRVLRFWNNDVFGNLEGVLTKIWEQLHESHSPHPDPPPLGEGVVTASPLGEGVVTASPLGEGVLVAHLLRDTK